MHDVDDAPSLRWPLISLILCLAIAGALYRLLVYSRLEQTAALFIGLPTILAVLLALTPRSKTPTGLILKGMTLGLLMSGPFLGEGFICILMAAPLFLLFGALIGLVYYLGNKFLGNDVSKKPLFVIALPLLFCSLEGVGPRFSFPRDETVRVEKVVAGTPEELESRLSEVPQFNNPLPFYLRLGFPRPVGSEGQGLDIGNARQIHFAGGEGKPGTLRLAVSDRGPCGVRFQAVSDSSHIAHWLEWKEAEVSWNEVSPGKTRVTWTLHYRRLLDPAWYFGPWERYAVGLAARTLLENLSE